jgi:hypothetical protein
VPQHVVPVDVLTDWDPHTPHAILLSGDGGRAVLALNPHPDDADRRCVALVWQGSQWSSMQGGPAATHELYEHGLQDVLGVGAVRQSERVAALTWRSGGELVHHVVRLPDRTVEVVAELLSVERIAGSTTAAAAIAALGQPDKSPSSGS